MAFFMFATVLSPLALAAEMRACFGDRVRTSSDLPPCCQPLADEPETCGDAVPGAGMTSSTCDHHKAKDRPASTQRVDTPSDAVAAPVAVATTPVTATHAPALLAPERTPMDFLSGTLLRI